MSRIVKVLVALALLLAAAAPARAGDEYVMKIATVAPDNTPWSELLKRFKKNVEAKSGGRIKVKVFLGGTLGDENDTVIQCKRGQIQAVGASTGALASQVPEVNVIELPFLFKTFAEADWVIDNVLTRPLEGIFAQYGLVLGFWSENGFRQFGTKDRFVKAPGDLKGKKMRSQESPIHLEMWKQFGASPVPIATTEVLTALQTNTVDGFDQAVLYAIAASWHKSIKYFTVSNHIYQPAIIAYNKDWFDKLPADLQKVVIDEGRAIQPKGRKAVRKILPDLLDVLRGEKVQVYELTDADKKAFTDASMNVRKVFRKTQGKKAVELLDAVEKGLADYRAGKVK